MIPEATHIAQAAGHDGMTVRETDLSMRVEAGWASAGRFSMFTDEKEEADRGYWVCHSLESDNEWDMRMAIVGKHTRLFAACEELLLHDEHFISSLVYLIHGTNDPETIAASLLQQQEEEE